MGEVRTARLAGGMPPAAPPIPAARGFRCSQCGRWQPPDRGVSGDEEESVMGVAKKAKHKAKAAKSKTKKDGGKAKHKGKKVKNAAKH
jgi:hypothetical protein